MVTRYGTRLAHLAFLLLCIALLTSFRTIAQTPFSDLDGDGMDDAFERLYKLDERNPKDAKQDPDKDRLTNLEEFENNTDPHNSDTDGDGMSDGKEVAKGTDPLLRGFKPKPFHYRCKILEDAEGKNKAKWSTLNLADNIRSGTMKTVRDRGNGRNHVLELFCETGQNRFVMEFPKSTRIRSVKLQWRMRTDEMCIVYVLFKTDAGVRYLQYVADDSPPENLRDMYARIGMGSDVNNGEWVTVRRDLEHDFQRVFPKLRIKELISVLFALSGSLDDIALFYYADADGDLLPDSYERRQGLNPRNPDDAKKRHLQRILRLSPTNPKEKSKRKAGTTTDDDTAEPKKKKKPTRKLSKDERDKLRETYRLLCVKYHKKAPKPRVGKTYRFRLHSGGLMEGELQSFSETHIVIKGEHGSMNVARKTIKPESAFDFFPKAYAKAKARSEVNRMAKKRLANKNAEDD
ncbi:MAG: hypothetical protein KAI66_09580 [Lentisphaeria bacterium]|nr:hypothetical protein [Lentisphaeria bacterium]